MWNQNMAEGMERAAWLHSEEKPCSTSTTARRCGVDIVNMYNFRKSRKLWFFLITAAAIQPLCEASFSKKIRPRYKYKNFIVTWEGLIAISTNLMTT